MRAFTGVVATACLIWQPGVAAAQPSMLAIALCKRIADDSARLKCFDAAVEQPPTPEKPGPTSWEIEESKSPIDDRPQISAMLTDADRKAALVARCKEGKTDFALVTDRYLGSTNDENRVVVRVGGAPAVTESWSGSTNGRGAFSRAPIPLLRSLPDNQTMFIRIFGYRGEAGDYTFNLADVSQVRAKIEETCKWPAPAAKNVPTKK